MTVGELLGLGVALVTAIAVIGALAWMDYVVQADAHAWAVEERRLRAAQALPVGGASRTGDAHG